MTKILGPPGPPPTTEFIVAEISKNWRDGKAMARTPLLSQQFETFIEYNRQRGYALHTFQLNRISPAPGVLNETIIAVFRRMSEPVAA